MEFPRIETHEILALDFETSGTHYWDPDFRVLGASLATKTQEWYWDFRTTPNVQQWLRDILPDRTVIAHFAQYEYQCCRTLGIDPRTINFYCTMTAAALIYEHHLTYDLASVAKQNGIQSRKQDILRQIAARYNMSGPDEVLSRFSEIRPADAAIYGANDARETYDIWDRQQHDLYEQSLFQVMDLERRLMPVLADMSWRGIRVDLAAAHAAIPKLDEQADRLQRDVEEITGGKFNVNSSPQVKAFFKPEQVNKFQWRLIDGTLVGPTKGGKGPSLDQKAMREIKHPLAAKILALRKTIKLRDTFIRGHVIGSADGDGYVHTTFNQTRNDADAGVVTGRLSSVDPALQQITKRDKENAAILRAMFLGDEGESWLCMDYSQVDFRCGAHLINDPRMVQAYVENPGLDYHQVVSEMTGIPRNPPYAGAPNTKQINLGLQFGAGAGKLAFMMGMDYEVTERRGKMQYLPGTEAKRVFDMYHSRLPGVKIFSDHCERVARATGYVKTQIGRRIREAGHKSAGLLFQAYAADLHKWGLVRCDATIRKERMPVRMMMTCHDELGASMKPDEEIKRKLQEVYTDFHSEEAPIHMRVPITSSAKFGANWYEASKD